MKSASLFAMWDDIKFRSYALVIEASLTQHLPRPGKTKGGSRKDMKLGVRMHGSCHFSSGPGFSPFYNMTGEKIISRISTNTVSLLLSHRSNAEHYK